MEKWKKMVKINRSILVFCPTIYLAWPLSRSIRNLKTLALTEAEKFDPICPKTLCNLSPTLLMLHIKFDEHWLTGLRDIHVSSEI